ncbi:MAG: BMP family ABC transporter substrate-binding protein [Lachnospiraceae bacterium]|nr:BMP family ABC transporter substrate-binding protein [Lachnospiraceae bacterium]
MIKDYVLAKKIGQKEYKAAVSKGKSPYLPVLDNILKHVETTNERRVGLFEIPLEYIVGTKTHERTESFSLNFMPILEENTEFAYKWSALYDSQLEEGIRDPIKVYEFMNQFYVQEGNKRVSVSRYVGANSIVGEVYRIMPIKNDEKQNKIYYEFLEFFKVVPIYLLTFSEEGSYQKLADVVGKDLETPWDDKVIELLKASYAVFEKAYKAQGGDNLDCTVGDAYLVYITFYSMDSLINDSQSLTSQRITKLWKEFKTQTNEHVTLVKTPDEIKDNNNFIKNVITNFIPDYTPSHPLKIAFLYDKNSSESAWTYGHELGRNHIENVFGELVETRKIDNLSDYDSLKEAIDKAVDDGVEMFFTVSPAMMEGTVKAAVHFPKVKFLNCSINLNYNAVRTYYGRMYEAKFIMGALAATRTMDGRIGYVADYPIFGTMANINAFAIGAAMVDPDVKIYLKWSSEAGRDWQKEFEDEGISVISGPDWIKPSNASRQYGVYKKLGDGTIKNLAAPLWNWGKYYEQIVKTVLNGSWDAKGLVRSDRALNYWWGMSAGVIDVILSDDVPYYCEKLVGILKDSIIRESLKPFAGELHSQDKVIQEKGSDELASEDIIDMNWLNDNVIGNIPKKKSIVEEAGDTLKMSAVDTVNKED